MKKVKIKPCPFCGKELEIIDEHNELRARCATRQCKGGKMPMLHMDSPADVAAWNMRGGGFDAPTISREVAHKIASEMTEAVGGNYFFYHAELDQFLDRLSATEVHEEVLNDDFNHAVGAD